jgi:hypothetical protein
MVSSLRRNSEDVRFLVFAAFLAQDLGDLAQAAVGMRGGDEFLEQVGTVSARGANRRQRRLGGGRIAFAAKELQGSAGVEPCAGFFGSS